MSSLSDDAIRRLRDAVDAPDLSGTRYTLFRRVGRGGMGSVHLARDAALDRDVAIKVVDLEDEGGALAGRLAAEAKILARLEHPGIVPVHDVGRLPDGRVFYAMRFVEGRPLHRELERVPELPARLRVFSKVCEAVAFANDRGVIHRDLKPENVMIGPFGEVLVMDWGVAAVVGAHAEPGVIAGTPGFMSPEQARGDATHLDARSDVYALGAMLRFLLADPAPPALRAVCAKAMREAPEERYPDALALSADVARYLDGLRVEAHPEGLGERVRRLYRRHRVAFWLVLSYLAVRGTLLVVSGR